MAHATVRVGRPPFAFRVQGPDDWMLLETGRPQTAAIGLYRSSGYVDVERFGYYAASESALNLGRRL
jgi:ribosomal protein S18 acetylase RimI-like enzyme